MRTGATPDGRQLDPRFMPWRSIGNATETGMRAMWAYLTTLAPAAARAED